MYVSEMYDQEQLKKLILAYGSRRLDVHNDREIIAWQWELGSERSHRINFTWKAEGEGRELQLGSGYKLSKPALMTYYLSQGSMV